MDSGELWSEDAREGSGQEKKVAPLAVCAIVNVVAGPYDRLFREKMS